MLKKWILKNVLAPVLQRFMHVLNFDESNCMWNVNHILNSKLAFELKLNFIFILTNEYK